MAFLQRKTEVSAASSLYTLSAEKQVLIVGLGNPGKEYEGTRHNIGYKVVEDFAQKNEFPSWSAMKDQKCEASQLNVSGVKVILCKPLTFMNDSGQAVSALARFFKINTPDILAVYDELAIPFGQIRARVGGSDAGHNGVKSLIEHVGVDFGRLRIGIGSERTQEQDASKFVLGKFTSEEKGALPLIVKEASSMLTEYIYGGELPHQTRTIV